VEYNLDVNPDFQRSYVWTLEQKVRYVEFILRGGQTGRNIYTNCPGWVHGERCNFVLVDGKQRLDATLGFLNNEFQVFNGNYYRDYTDRLPFDARFRWHVNTLETREHVLQWYLDLNQGGTIHTPAELDKVKALLRDKVPYIEPTPDELLTAAGMHREAIQAALKVIQDEEAEMARRNEERAALKAAKPTRKKKK
jgi:hypothetical protein